MTIEAKVIADSISEQGIRLTTFQLRYPRFIHAEAKTHRIIEIDGIKYEEMVDMGFMDDPSLSRNASSSRAIPVKRMIEDLRRDPAMPVYWGSNQPGMQAGDELDETMISICKADWIHAMENAIESAQRLMTNGLHKQIANRILEPWAHINVVVTATDYANFYALRRHKDAQPEIKVLADAMWDAQQASIPETLLPGDWHLPYADGEDVDLSTPEAVDLAKKVSVARCGRVSYLTHDGRPTTVEEDLALYERLVGNAPLHASPAEHQATPDTRYLSGTDNGLWRNAAEHGNFTGWRQLRKMLPNEFVPG